MPNVKVCYSLMPETITRLHDLMAAKMIRNPSNVIDRAVKELHDREIASKELVAVFEPMNPQEHS